MSDLPDPNRGRPAERRSEFDGPSLGPFKPDPTMVFDPFEIGGLPDFEPIGSAAESEGGYHPGFIRRLEIDLEQPVEMRWGTFRSRLMSENRRSKHRVIDPARVIAEGTAPPYHASAGAVAFPDLASPIAQESP